VALVARMPPNKPLQLIVQSVGRLRELQSTSSIRVTADLVVLAFNAQLAVHWTDYPGSFTLLK